LKKVVILIRVKTFLEEVKSGSIDTDKFISDVKASSSSMQKKYAPFITMNEGFGKAKPQKGVLQYLPVSVKDCLCAPKA
jgi:hypothetical protein